MQLLNKMGKHSLLLYTSLSLVLSPIADININFSSVVHAEENNDDMLTEETVAQNIYTDSTWPSGPSVTAHSAILMEANTGTILYGKNIHDRMFPASITKLLTGYVAVNHAEMDETITFSEDAVYSINWRNDANMGLKVGEQISMEDALYGVFVGSANEAAYAVGEHISGDIESFSDLMNETAKVLGCTDSHFVNPNGIHDDNHYTSAHDMALIGKAFFSNELLCTMSSTSSYKVPASSTQSNDNLIVWAKSKLLPGKKYAYDHLVGTKTGYTDEANQTLVSCAEKDGIKLVCVILSDESPNQFLDTVALFDFGFNNFKSLNISELDTEYEISDSNFFSSNSDDLFGNSSSILELAKEDYVIVPNDITYQDLTSSISYDSDSNQNIARIDYLYHDIPVGSVHVNIIQNTTSQSVTFDEVTEDTSAVSPNDENIIFIDIFKTAFWGILGIIVVFLLIVGYGTLCYKRRRNRKRSKIKRTKYRSNTYLDL